MSTYNAYLKETLKGEMLVLVPAEQIEVMYLHEHENEPISAEAYSGIDEEYLSFYSEVLVWDTRGTLQDNAGIIILEGDSHITLYTRCERLDNFKTEAVVDRLEYYTECDGMRFNIPTKRRPNYYLYK